MKKYGLIIFAATLACIFALTAFAAESFIPGSDAVCFVDNALGKDTNAGTTAAKPFKTLSKANTFLKEASGGTIVISGDVKIESGYAPNEIDGAVIYTSVFGGVDYRKTKGAALSVGANMAFNSDAFFENIDLEITETGLVFSGRCHNFGMGDGVNVTNASSAESFVYPTLIGGWNSPGTLEGSSNANDYTTFVYSGTWDSVSAGHKRNLTSQPVSSLRGDVALVIKGGTFKSTVFGTGMNVHTKRFYM
ncbi:MAG: hypothetical protein IKY12_01845, partial [Clostridia bacterium]|nr:hypothetical protein [Clostridia bacterium]